MRYLLKVIWISCLGIFSCSNTNQVSTFIQLPDLIPYNKKGHWGYCDKDKKIVIDCKYDYAELFDSFGLAQVFKEDKDNYNNYGGVASNVALIDMKGKMVVPFQSSDKFAYTVIPYDGKNDSIYGVYKCHKFKDYLIVFGSYYFQLANQKIFKKYVKGRYSQSKYIAINRQGDRILGDSFYYVTHHQTKDRVHYIIGEHISSGKKFVFSRQGKLLNQLSFDKCLTLDSTHFVGIQMTEKRNYKSSGIFTTTGKKKIQGKYEFRDRIGHFTRSDNRYYNFKFAKFVGKGFFNSHYHYQFYNNFTIVPEKIGEDLSYTIIKQDLSPLYKGGFNKIDVDTTFKHIFLYQKNNILIGNYQGNIISTLPYGDEAEMISVGFCKVKIGNKYGLWSVAENRFVAPISYKIIEKMRENRFVLEDSAKMILVDRLGNYYSSDVFDKISWKSNTGFRNDSLFYIYPNDDLTFVDYDTKYVFQYGNILYYRIYRKNIGTNGEGQKLFAWNTKTSSFIEMDKIEFRTRFEFKNQKYVSIDKEISYNYKTGIVKSLTGLLDKNGNIAIEPKYQNIEYFPNFILARKGNTNHIYNHNKENKLVLTLRFTLPTNTYFTQLNNDNGLIELLYDTKTNTKSRGYIDLYGTKYYE